MPSESEASVGFERTESNEMRCEDTEIEAVH